MTLRTYSSLAAFIAHYETLRAAHADPLMRAAHILTTPRPSPAMESIVGELSPADREALREASSSTDAHPTGTAARHRARAELKLHRLLAARGLLAG